MRMAPVPNLKTSKDLKELQGWQHQIIIYSAGGMKPKEVAEATGKSFAVVNNIVNSPAGQAAVSRIFLSMENDLQASFIRIQAMQPKALDVLEDILGGESAEITPQVQLKAATEVLDRGGLPRSTNIQASKAFLESNSLLSFIDRSEEMNIIEDAEFTILEEEDPDSLPPETPFEAAIPESSSSFISTEER